jgi:hypothetical protein
VGAHAADADRSVDDAAFGQARRRLDSFVLLPFVSACSKGAERTPVAPSASVVVHDTLNAAGGTSNAEFYDAMRSAAIIADDR